MFYDFISLPPKFIVVLLIGCLLTSGVAFSRLGLVILEEIPLWLIVGSQAFRIPVELFLHWAYESQMLPKQLTYLGWNYDILTGITALLMAWGCYHRKLPSQLLWTWNVMGLTFLVTVVGTAILSAPTPFQQFPLGSASTFLPVDFPYIWLPMILVQFALLGHLLIFRTLFKKTIKL